MSFNIHSSAVEWPVKYPGNANITPFRSYDILVGLTGK